MGRVAPSVMAREQLRALLAGGVERESNIISALVEAMVRLMMQELLQGEQGDFLGGRGRDERRTQGQVGSRNGYEPGRVRTAEGAIDVAVPQVRGAGEPFRSSLMGFLEGNSEVLERLVCEMYARGLSTRDVEDAFRDATGELLISKSAVSEITDRLWEDYQAFIARDLSRSAWNTYSSMRSLSRCAATAPRKPYWSPGALPPMGANTCCIWRWATRKANPAGPPSSATCWIGACGCPPPSPPMEHRG
jgi:hypothetical protein